MVYSHREKGEGQYQFIEDHSSSGFINRWCYAPVDFMCHKRDVAVC